MPGQFTDKDSNRRAKARRVAYLLSEFVRGAISSKDHDELDEWVGASEMNMRLFEELTKEENVRKGLAWMNENIPFVLKEADTELEYDTSLWFKKSHLIFAASLLIALFIFLITLIKNKSEEDGRSVSRTDKPDPAPQYNKHNAVLTLADGRIVILNQASEGEVAIQGANNIVKGNGTLQYTHSILSAAMPICYNLLVTPRGSTYTLTLPDGTKAWLNAASSIRFPTAFDGKERRVVITGEVYFEIAESTIRPFIVDIKGRCKVRSDSWPLQININAYADEEELQITLVKGTAHVSANRNVETVQAGQYAKVSKNSVKIRRLFDIKHTTGWKDGQICLLDVDLPTFLRYIGRCYDFDITYDNTDYDKSAKQYMIFSRDQSNIRNLLYSFEREGNVFFKVEGKKIRVMPRKQWRLENLRTTCNPIRSS
jgi:transmembrane sensor